MMMQAHLLVGPVPTYTHNRSSGATGRRHWCGPVASSSSPGFRPSNDYEQNHYDVLGLKRSATGVDIKRAFRLLARKHHPDVSKDSQSSETFKSIRHAYEVLSNEATRTHYDRDLQFAEDSHRQQVRKRQYNNKFDEFRAYRWSELRRSRQRKRNWERYKVNNDKSHFYSEVEDDDDDDEMQGQGSKEERVSFREVVRSAFLSLFLMQAFGCWLSLTYSSFAAFLDKKLDDGYKIGYLVAWILGGRSGILLTLCLSIASWVCGKASSSLVVLVMVAMWVGPYLARYAPSPLPQGAFLTLLFVSIKLQDYLN